MTEVKHLHSAATTIPLGHLREYKNDGKYWPVNTKYLVVVHQYDGDVSWAKELKFPHIIYEKTDKSTNEPFIAINKAKAETNTLKFIAQFYHDLPENIIHVYQYNRKHYHNGTLVDLLNSPKFITDYETSLTPGFLNFNNCHLGDVNDPATRMKDTGFWAGVMADPFGEIGGYGNFTRWKKACAQFVVSRDRISSLPREWYVNAYTWLVTNTIDDVASVVDPITLTRTYAPLDHHPLSSWYTSRFMEFTWELIFTAVKPDEKIGEIITLDVSAQKFDISATYGAKLYQRDVTSLVLDKWYYNSNIIVIPGGIDMNGLFSDTVWNSPKVLTVTVNEKVFAIKEGHPHDTLITLSVLPDLYVPGM